MAIAAHRIRWWEPILTGREEALVNDVLRSGYLNDGEVTAAFEHRIAVLFGVAHAVATTSGTSAIFLALAAAGVGPGDDVIVPDVTFIATANAVRLAGATPVLVDIDPRTLTIDIEAAEAAITPRTRAIVPVHVSGRPAAIDRIVEIARRRGLAVIEDAAEAFLSKLDGRCLGTIGDAGCLSFSPNKMIMTGQGGMVLTHRADLAARVRALKDHGRPVRGTGGNDLHPTLGFNFKLTNLQAAVGLAQAEAIESRVEKTRQLFRAYRRGLEGVEGIVLPGFDVDAGVTPQWIDAVAEDRDALIAHLLERQIDCRPFWFPLHTQRPYLQADAPFPVSTSLIRRALWLPSALSLTEADIETVCSEIRAFYAAPALSR